MRNAPNPSVTAMSPTRHWFAIACRYSFPGYTTSKEDYVANRLLATLKRQRLTMGAAILF
jgi:hypothetical protein